MPVKQGWGRGRGEGRGGERRERRGGEHRFEALASVEVLLVADDGKLLAQLVVVATQLRRRVGELLLHA
jgi:hypothetical protein